MANLFWTFFPLVFPFIVLGQPLAHMAFNVPVEQTTQRPRRTEYHGPRVGARRNERPANVEAQKWTLRDSDEGGRTAGRGQPVAIDGHQQSPINATLRNRHKRNVFKQWTTWMNETNYDKYTLPKMDDDKPVEVTVSIMIIRVHSISHSNMEYGIELYYREHWHDYRLAYNASDYDNVTQLNLPMPALNYIWKPDTYFLNAISAHSVKEDSVTHRAFFRLNYTGHVNYSRKISLNADCHMDLSMYPFDKQYCKLILGTYSHFSEDLVYNWAKPRGYDVELKDPIRMTEYYAGRLRTSKRKQDYTTGSFDSLELCMVFKRSAGFCILQVIIPSTAVVMCSWVALWMAEDTSFSDVIAVILAIIFLAFSYNSVMPRVSYMKLLDLYMCACFVFVFLSLAKLVIIKYFCKKWAKEGTHSSEWFLAQLAGISMVQQKNAASAQEEEDAENGKESDEGIGSSSDRPHDENQPLLIHKPSMDKHRNGLLPRPSNASRVPSRRSTRIFDETCLESGEGHESAQEKDSMVDSLSQSFHTGTSIATEEFLELMMKHGDGNNVDEDPNEKRQSRPNFTFLGLEAFTSYFSRKHKKRQWRLERRMKYLRFFNIATQVALPIGFAVFFVLLLVVYPNIPRKRGC